MKNVLLSLVFVLFIVPVFAQSNITISKIRIVLDGRIEYVWTNKSEIPQKDPTGYTDPVTIASFLPIAPGDKVDLAWLESQIYSIESRMAQSGYFYNVKINIIPPRQFPDRRTILIELQEGFLFRFAGGNAFGMFGIDNLEGKRKEMRIIAGANQASFGYVDELFLDTPFILGGIVDYQNSLLRGETRYQYHRADGKLIFGYRILPDLSVGFNTRLRYLHYSDLIASIPAESLGGLDQLRLNISPNLNYWSSIGNADTFLDYMFSCNFGYDQSLGQTNSGISAMLKTGFNFSFLKNLSFGVQLSGGQTSYSLEKYDLLNTPEMSIRSEQGSSLTANRYAMANIEFRFLIATLQLPPIFTIKLKGVLFSDFGVAASGSQDILQQPLLDAYGCGLRIIFDNPIFVYVSLEYGWNHTGAGKFIFSMTGGFLER